VAHLHKKSALASNTKAHQLFRNLLAARLQDRPRVISSFPRKYRAIASHQDELVSTASVRSLVQGVLESNPGLQTQEVMTDLLSQISDVRLPTKMVGFALKGSRMQHPTGKGALFGPPKGTGSRHALLDLRRRATVESALKESQTSGENAQETVHAGIRAAIAFTLNEMASPPTASDIEPNLPRKLTSAEQTNANMLRESLKARFVALGGTQEVDTVSTTPDEQRGRRWRTNRSRSDRSVSPTR
jgi:hypothetical protein